MRDYFPRVYRSFEEFEREELGRQKGLEGSIEDMLDTAFAEELDLEGGGESSGSSKRRRRGTAQRAED
jgi:hypothetical protein